MFIYDALVRFDNRQRLRGRWRWHNRNHSHCAGSGVLRQRTEQLQFCCVLSIRSAALFTYIHVAHFVCHSKRHRTHHSHQWRDKRNTNQPTNQKKRRNAKKKHLVRRWWWLLLSLLSRFYFILPCSALRPLELSSVEHHKNRFDEARSKTFN